MTWPEPPKPMDGFAGGLLVVASILLAAWLFSPIFNLLMRVLQ